MTEGYCISDGMHYAADIESLKRVLTEFYGEKFSEDELAVEIQLDDLYHWGVWYWAEWKDDDIIEDDDNNTEFQS